MAEETFAKRLKTSMENQGKKQIDLIRMAQERGIKLGKSHMRQKYSESGYTSFSCGRIGSRRRLVEEWRS